MSLRSSHFPGKSAVCLNRYKSRLSIITYAYFAVAALPHRHRIRMVIFDSKHMRRWRLNTSAICSKSNSRTFWCAHMTQRTRRAHLQASVCGSPMVELVNPGASGSIFYRSSDDQFILKTVQSKEAEFLTKLLPGYYMVRVPERLYARCNALDSNVLAICLQ